MQGENCHRSYWAFHLWSSFHTESGSKQSPTLWKCLIYSHIKIIQEDGASRRERVSAVCYSHDSIRQKEKNIIHDGKSMRKKWLLWSIFQHAHRNRTCVRLGLNLTTTPKWRVWKRKIIATPDLEEGVEKCWMNLAPTRAHGFRVTQPVSHLLRESTPLCHSSSINIDIPWPSGSPKLSLSALPLRGLHHFTEQMYSHSPLLYPL